MVAAAEVVARARATPRSPITPPNNLRKHPNPSAADSCGSPRAAKARCLLLKGNLQSNLMREASLNLLNR